MAQMPDIKRYFYHTDGTPLNAGRDFEEPGAGRHLARHRQGRRASAFYTGAIAAAIVDKVQNAPVNKAA